MAAVVEAGDGLLAGIAPLREADRVLLEPCLGRQHPVVELAAPRGRAGEDPQPLELLVGDRLGRISGGVDQLVGRHAVVRRRDRAVRRRAPEDDRRHVLLRLDRALRGEAESDQLGRYPLAERRLGEDEEVVGAAPQDGQGGDQPCLRGEQQRLARLAGREGLDVVRDHALEVRGGVLPRHADVRARSDRSLQRLSAHEV